MGQVEAERERSPLTLAELQNAPQLIISKCVKSHAAHVVCVVYELMQMLSGTGTKREI